MIGERALRREDPRFLTGHGRYLADHDVAGLAHIAILRSPAAHADVRAIDCTRAVALPGVVGVYTQADLDGRGRPADGSPARDARYAPLEWGVLATDRVRFVGEPVVAAVVATSRAVAEDALDLVELDLEPLPAVVDPVAALAPDAPLLYPEWGTNEFLHLEAASPGLADVLAAAPHVLRERFESHRIMGLPLEGPRRAGRVRSRRPACSRCSRRPSSRISCARSSRRCAAWPRPRCGWSRPTWAAGSATSNTSCARSAWSRSLARITRRAGALERGPHRGAHRVGALAAAGPRGDRRRTTTTVGCSRSTSTSPATSATPCSTSRASGPSLVTVGALCGALRRSRARVVVCGASRRPPARSARTAASASRRRTSPSSG